MSCCSSIIVGLTVELEVEPPTVTQGDPMELVPEVVKNTLVFNVVNSCNANRNLCGNCSDFAVAVHNTLMNTEVKYVLIDLQDEKEMCPSFLEELMQLAKRMKFPFLFTGVMDRPQRILESYAFLNKHPLFESAEDAVDYLEKNYPGITRVSLNGIEIGVAVASSRPRNAVAGEGETTEGEAEE